MYYSTITQPTTTMTMETNEPFVDDYLDGPSLSPVLEEESSLTSAEDSRSRKTTVIIYMFLLACLFLASLWCIFAIRSYRSEQVAPGEHNRESMSIEKIYYDKIMTAFEKLGNKTILTKENFKSTHISCEKNLSRPEAACTETENTTSAKDLEAGLDDADGNDNDDQSSSILVIKRSTMAGQPELTFTNCCAICLDSYNVGDTVSWSLNEECNHVFHQFCLANSFAHARKKGKKCLCPTCRRRFFLKHDRPVQ